MRADGTGGSFGCGLALTPGAPAGRRGHGGLLLFVRDLDRGLAWRLGDPAGAATRPLATIENGIARLEHEQAGIRAEVTTCVVPGRRAELRRVVLSATDGRARRLDVTTLAEVALNEAPAHAAHPGFSKLFVQTEAEPGAGLLVARRRPRSPHEKFPLLAHALGGDGPLQWETDRLRWQGRGRPAGFPAALAPGAELGGHTGNVLDPVVSLRRSVDMPAGGTVELALVLGLADDADDARALAALATDPAAVAAAFAKAAAAGACVADDRGWTPAGEASARSLAAAILDADEGLRAPAPAAEDGPGTLALLARLGLPANRPLAVADATAGAGSSEGAARLAGLHAFWRELGLPIESVILEAPGAAAARGNANGSAPLPGLHRLDAASLDARDRGRLLSCAALAVTTVIPEPASTVTAGPDAPAAAAAPLPPAGAGLRFFNGCGGFTPDGREYVIRVPARADGSLALPPLPWTNVIANERFGCIVSEAAVGSSWCDNSRENRLTPWSNDPVCDPASETFAVRDDESGAVASCLPEPGAGAAEAEVRHGFGYTTWRRRAGGLELETTLHVDRERPARLVRVRVANPGPASRQLTVVARTTLESRDASAPAGAFLRAWRDETTGAVFAADGGCGPFAGRLAFAAAVTGDEAATVAAPAAGRAVIALEASFTLDAGRERVIFLVLGQDADESTVRGHLQGLGTTAACEQSLQAARDFWREGLGALKVETPSPALDLMLGGWLGYQTLSCRVNGRSAFYQSGGAFGYRDQLQDSLALLPYWPERTRRQVVLHAGHQFAEGDVLHWWHPPLEAGIRTRFADDLLWLPYVACEYARWTGDWAVFDEQAPYLSAPALADGEDEVFVHAVPSGEQGDIYGHCCRAIDRSLATGAHGLPLFGTGDWNDGMNRVGRLGRGESTWMGFFLVAIIDAFAPLCERRGEPDRAQRYREHRERLVAALNDGGWDGQWYRRGYYDDGAPLGSRENRECRIDALAQAWSVLSKAAPAGRAAMAMDQVEAQLVNDDERLVRLLTPPFVDTPRDPGYIRGYVAGVRENGGQYTHAATWVVRALAELRRRDRAARVLDLLNPVLHAGDPAAVERYKVEPYVVAADVYGAEPHVGRGGWTWYTGSSGWLQRVALESVLGLRVEGGDTLVVDPCVPDEWPGFSLEWRLPGDGSTYVVRVANPGRCSRAVVAATIDGRSVDPVDGRLRLPLRRDGGRHELTVTLGDETGRR